MDTAKGGPMGKEPQKPQLNRRTFITGMVTAGAALAGTGLVGCNTPQTNTEVESTSNIESGKHSWEIAPDPIPDDQIISTVDTDIIIVGAGVAGVAAAEAASAAGASVIVIEQADKCTAHGADNAAIGTRMQKAQGIEIDPDEATRLLFRWTQQQANYHLIHTWATRSGEVFDHFNDLADKIGLGVIPAISNTSKVDWADLDDAFKEFRSGITFGDKDEGIIIDTDSFTFIETHLVEMLHDEAVANGAEFLFNTKGEQLIKDDERVSGIICSNEEGYLRYNASRGVILATGDISGNEEMLELWCPIALRADSTAYFPPNGNLGDGIKMGMWVGAAPSKSTAGHAVHPIALYPLTILDMSWLAVNRDGERFMNEMPYEPTATNARMNAPGNIAWSIYDTKYPERVRAQEPITGEALLTDAEASIEEALKGDFMFRADTLEELASLIGVPAETFESTVARYNELCALGNDTDFGVPPRFLAAVEEGPFYASRMPAQTLVVPFGLHVDKNSQVCTAEDDPIEGLFAVGNVQGDFYGCSYPVICPGLSHGRSLTFGNLVGTALVEGTTINA